MRIGIDASSVARATRTGIGRYIAELVGGLSRLESGCRFDLLYRPSRWKRRRHFLAPPDPSFRTRCLLERMHFGYPRRLSVFHGPDARLPRLPRPHAELDRIVVDEQRAIGALGARADVPPDFAALGALAGNQFGRDARRQRTPDVDGVSEVVPFDPARREQHGVLGPGGVGASEGGPGPFRGTAGKELPLLVRRALRLQRLSIERVSIL